MRGGSELKGWSPQKKFFTKDSKVSFAWMDSLRRFKIVCHDKAARIAKQLERMCLTISSFGEAYGSDGARGRSSHSKSPVRPSYVGNSFNSYDGHSQNRSSFRADGWGADRGGSNMQPVSNFDYPSFPQSLEELELQYKREAMELAKLRDKEEDDENFKHREVCCASIFLCAGHFELIFVHGPECFSLDIDCILSFS